MLKQVSDTRLGRTPQAETAYQRGRQLWDERMGSALAQAQTWRTTAFASLGLAALLAVVATVLALRPAAVPYVIERHSTGEAVLLGVAGARHTPSDNEISYQLMRWVSDVRGISADPVVVRENWLRAYDWVTEQGAQTLNAMGAERDPLIEVGRTTIAAEVLSIVRASPDSFQIRWREKTYQGGVLTGVQRFSGVATIQTIPPDTPERIQKNPFGIYVHAFHWSQDMQQ